MAGTRPPGRGLPTPPDLRVFAKSGAPVLPSA